MFHMDDFTGETIPFGEDEALLIAKIANKLIDERSVVLYGNQHDDFSCTNFTSQDHRTDEDTHVLRGIEISTMGSLPRHTKPILDDAKITEKDLLRAERERNIRNEKKIKAMEDNRGQEK